MNWLAVKLRPGSQAGDSVTWMQVFSVVESFSDVQTPQLTFLLRLCSLFLKLFSDSDSSLLAKNQTQCSNSLSQICRGPIEGHLQYLVMDIQWAVPCITLLFLVTFSYSKFSLSG